MRHLHGLQAGLPRHQRGEQLLEGDPCASQGTRLLRVSRGGAGLLRLLLPPGGHVGLLLRWLMDQPGRPDPHRLSAWARRDDRRFLLPSGSAARRCRRGDAGRRSSDQPVDAVCRRATPWRRAAHPRRGDRRHRTAQHDVHDCGLHRVRVVLFVCGRADVAACAGPAAHLSVARRRHRHAVSRTPDRQAPGRFHGRDVGAQDHRELEVGRHCAAQKPAGGVSHSYGALAIARGGPQAPARSVQAVRTRQPAKRSGVPCRSASARIPAQPDGHRIHRPRTSHGGTGRRRGRPRGVRCAAHVAGKATAARDLRCGPGRPSRTAARQRSADRRRLRARSEKTVPR